MPSPKQSMEEEQKNKELYSVKWPGCACLVQQRPDKVAVKSPSPYHLMGIISNLGLLWTDRRFVFGCKYGESK